MNRVGAKTRLIPKENVAALGFCLAGDGGKRLATPAFDRFRITLIGALQRLLQRQADPGEQRPNSTQTELHIKLLLDQLGDDRAVHRPKSRPYWHGSLPLIQQNTCCS